MKLGKRRFWLALLWCSLTWQVSMAACLNPAVLQVAQIPHDALNLVEEAQQPLFQAMAQETGKPVVAVPVASYAAVIERLLAGEVHVAELGPASYAMLSQRSPHFVPFAALSNTAEAGRYQSLLVVRNNAPYQRLEDLRGKSIAFTDPFSTSGAMVPSLMLKQATGYTAEHFFSRVLYTGAHDRSGAAVQQGKAQAAFVASSLVDIDALGLRVLWRSPSLTENPFLMDSRLCPALQTQLRRAFLEEQARLQPWLEQRKFKQVVPVSPKNYAGIQALLAQP